MKNIKLILVAIFVLTFIVSCDNYENDTKETLKKATISAKWSVSNSIEYESFEFNESGNYIIVENATTKSTNNQIILFGTYEIINSETIVLSDFGTLIISVIDENSFSFSIKLTSNPDNEIKINASKQEEMESSTRTDLLCRTWEMVTENGIPVSGTNMELTVLFSKAGTYFVSFANPEDESEGGLALWKWKDDAETQLFYCRDETSNWDEEDYIGIPELTSTTLKIVEEEDTWIFQPVSNTKSARLKTANEI